MSEIFRNDAGMFVDSLEPGLIHFAVEGSTDLNYDQATTLAHSILAHIEQHKKESSE